MKALARFEATSEDSRYPIESAFEEDGQGWRAVEVGEQAIRARSSTNHNASKKIDSAPYNPIRNARSSSHCIGQRVHTATPRPLVREQWNFSPPGSIMQIEEYEVDLHGVRLFQLVVRPEIKRSPAVATLVSWHLA